ncbi:hypothetical protein, partial [Oribacterium sp. FC2011]|uniref:hypothetical protein n=1 Tax=Oribacterium sp. FC2011 TaxID=1408311 RepID=UPI001A9A4C71
MVKGYFRYFLDIQVEQFSERSVICVCPLEHAKHHIPDIGYGKVCCQRIKRCALAFLRIFQILLASLEIDLNIPYADILEMP